MYNCFPLSIAHLSDFDKYLMGEGTHERAYEKLGTHLLTLDGHTGVAFAVWAPNAQQVSVIGDFNKWDGSKHIMHSSDSGIWTLFISDLAEHAVYQYHIVAGDGQQFDKSDPYGFSME